MHFINKVLQPPLGALNKSAVQFTPLVKEGKQGTWLARCNLMMMVKEGFSAPLFG
jgi:hypothetical protein